MLLLLTVARSNGILQTDRSHEIDFSGEKYILDGYDIIKVAGDSLAKIGSFPMPTLSLLERYRSDLEHPAPDEDRASFFSKAKDMGSLPSFLHVCEEKIWVGFAFYEDEFSTGYGGIGFIDPATGEIGVLRHPTLVAHSVSALACTVERIFVETIKPTPYRASPGLVVIDKHTLNARRFSVRGEITFPTTPDDMTNEWIQKLVADSVLIERENYQREKTERLEMDLEQLMICEYHREVDSRRDALKNRELLLEITLTLDSAHTTHNIQSKRHRPYFIVNGLPYLNTKQFSNILIFLPLYGSSSQLYQFAAYPEAKKLPHWTEYPTEIGTIINYQTSKFWFDIVLKDFDQSERRDGQKPVKLFKSVTLHAKVFGIR